MGSASPNYLHRKLLSISHPSPDLLKFSNPINNRLSIKILTWNILAQCLVRRSLFPGCDCLKWKERGTTITQEVIDYDPDLICLQEVDRLSDHGPILSAAGYDFTHVIGGYEDEGKQHGLLIGWKRARFDSIAEKVIRLDEESVGPRAGLSRSTRNVALMCTLRSKQDPHSGLIIGTAHLFWHARFAYERARQAAFLSRAIQSFRADQSTITWPVFLAGDFNDQPGGPAYRFMTGLSLDDHQRQIFKQSSLVHRSVDDVAGQPREGEYATIEGDEDQVFKDVRSANVGDGLFEEAELRSICGPHRWVSLYGRWGDQMQGQEGNWFKDREEEIARRAKHGSKELSREHQLMRGDFEPMWSSSSHSWVRQALDDH